MIIPIGVDVPFDRRPFVNWLVVITTVFIFGLQILAAASGEGEAMREYLLNEKGPFLKGLFGHMWIHGGILHIFGNMLFLWVFGNAVCSKIGNKMYFPVYILLGLAAAFTYNIFSNNPMLGASGAVNGIVGMYLVFFPLNEITCFYWFYLHIGGTFSLSSFWMVLFWFGFDVLGVVAGGQGVAYTAHLGGLFTGIALAIVLLKFRIVVMEDDERSLLQVFSSDNSKQAEEDRLWELRHSYSQLDRDLYRAENEFEQEVEDEYEDENEDERVAGLQRRFAYQRGEYREEPAALVETVDDAYIRFSCQCGKRIKVPTKYAGKTGKCPKCTTRVQIPG